VLAAAACGGDLDTEDPTVATILQTVPRTIAVGERGQASAQALGYNGLIIPANRTSVRFSSANATVASVDAGSGVVTGLAPGRAAIVAESQGRSATDTVQVVAR
jgi:hypothetical protein